MHIVLSELLPAAAASCHASTVLPLPSGEVLCAFFAGTREGDDDVDIYLCRRTSGAWSAPQKMSEGPGPHWNPVLTRLPDGDLLLFYKVGRPIAEWRTLIRRSTDEGKSWSTERELVPNDAGGRGPVRCKPIWVGGRMLAPASLERGYWRAFVDISEDGGLTWRASNEITIPGPHEPGRGVIQPTLWADGGGVHMLLRSSEGYIYRSDSEDGERFCGASPTNLPNNNSGIDLVKLPDGVLLMAHNPVGDNWGARTPLTLSISRDDGRSFEKIVDLAGGEGEFSYPAMEFDGKYLHLSHTFKRQRIMYHKIATHE